MRLLRRPQVLQARPSEGPALRFGVARVDVGMLLARQLSVGLADLFLRRSLGDAESLAVVSHDSSPMLQCAASIYMT